MKYKYIVFFMVALLCTSVCTFFENLSTSSISLKVLAQATLVFEWNIISKLSPNVLETMVQSVSFNPKNGAVGRNNPKFVTVAFQRHSSELIAYGILTKDVPLVSTAIKMLEYGFVHQRRDGSFPDFSPERTPGSIASGVAFFYSDLGHSLLLCKNSDWFQNSQETVDLRIRLNKLLTPVDASLTWLMSHQKALIKNDQKATNRLFFDASAYYLVGKAINRNDAVNVGERFIKLALKQQTETGFFLEKGGYDSSYQAVSLWLSLLLYTNRQPDVAFLKQDLWTAISQGMNWEVSRILPTGEVSIEGNTRVYPGGESYFGKEKGVDYNALIVALNYYAKVSSDDFVQNVANQVLRFKQHT